MANGDDQVTFQSPTTGKVQPVPQEHWDTAMQQGYKPVSHKVMYSPDGTRGMVKNEDLRGYMQQRYQTTPKTSIERAQEGNRGFLGTLSDKLKGALQTLGTADPTGGRSLSDPRAWLDISAETPPMLREATRPLPANLPTDVLGGRGTAGARPLGRGIYRAATTLSPLVPFLNPEAMERASATGDTGAVAAEAAIPAAAAVGSAALPRAVGPLRERIGAAIRDPATGRVMTPSQAALNAAFPDPYKPSAIPAKPIPKGTNYGQFLGRQAAEARMPEPVDPLTQAVREGRAARLPTRMPLQPKTPPPAAPFLPGATPSNVPLGSAEVPSLPPNLRQPEVKMVERFKPPEQSRIVEPGSKPPDYKVTYQSVPQAELRSKVMSGDADAIREWQRRGLDLPANVGYMVEGGASPKPWRARQQ